jgi:hypothetical protein
VWLVSRVAPWAACTVEAYPSARCLLGDEAGGQHHRLPPALTGAEGLDLEAAVVADAGDAVGLAVDRAAAVALVSGEVPGVVAGLHEVPDAGGGALQAVSTTAPTPPPAGRTP